MTFSKPGDIGPNIALYWNPRELKMTYSVYRGWLDRTPKGVGDEMLDFCSHFGLYIVAQQYTSICDNHPPNVFFSNSTHTNWFTSPSICFNGRNSPVIASIMPRKRGHESVRQEILEKSRLFDMSSRLQMRTKTTFR